jgi:DNA polymerase-3 subunit alpha
MCFLTGSDNTGSISLVVFPDLYKTNNNFQKNEIIKIKGKVERRYDEYQVVCIVIDR